MIGKKINELATELAPVSTDLTIIGDPLSGVSKKITIAQLGAIFSGAVSFYTNLASFPAVGDINVIYCAKDTKKLYLWDGSTYVEVFPAQALLDTYQLRSEKGVSNGYASLDSSGKVPVSQLPSSLMEYLGTWNAATNTPTLANGTGDNGDVYLCNVAGTVNFGAGPITFAVGDWVIYNGTIWERSSGSVGTVTSVAVSRSGDALAITGSPITTSGTINIGFAGTGAQYIKGDGTLATFPNTIEQARNLITEVYNNTGATLTKGTIVYINGGSGNLPTVTKALATGDTTSAQTFGFIQNDITNNNNGYVVIAGKLSDIDTQAFVEGTQLYLSATTAGEYTSTKQYAPNHLVYVGVVVRSHPTQGIIEVKIQNGYELDELHNVSAQTPTNNDGLFWESSTSLWKNKSIATILGYTPQAQLNGTGFVKASGTTITYDNSTYLTTSVAATTYLPMVLSSTAKVVDINGQQFSIYDSTGGFTSGRIIVDPVFSAIGYQNAGVFDGLKILTNGNAEFSNSGVTRFFNQVRFDSTLTNGTYTYTLPSATGTIALTSDLTGGTVTSVGLSVPTGFDVSGSPVTSSGTLALSFTTGYSLPTIAKQGNWDTAYNTRIVTASSPLSFISNVLSISQASGSANGYLSSTDWTTFNNKQSALTNPVTGTGTTNYLPKFTGTSTIGNSQIFDNGTNVGINTTSPAATLDVNGTIYARSASGIFSDVFTAYSGGNLTLGYGAAGSLIFNGGSGGATRMRLDASGNLGLGVTPSAWSVFKVMQIGSGFAAASSGTGNARIFSNTYYDGSYRYVANGTATQYEQDGYFAWYTAPSGTAGNAISFTQAMTLNASGNLSIGNTNDTYKLDVTGQIRVNGNTNEQLILDYTTASGGFTWQSFRINGINKYRIFGNTDNSFILYSNVLSSNVLTIASTGAATFSSSVTATQFITGGTPSNTAGFTNSFYAESNTPSLTLSNTGTNTGKFTLGVTNGNFGIWNNATSTYPLFINSSNNVGIGTTSPTSKLHVVGLPNSSSGLTAGAIWIDGTTLKIVT